MVHVKITVEVEKPKVDATFAIGQQLRLSHKPKGRKLGEIPIDGRSSRRWYKPRLRKPTMSITLDLPQELESELATEATQLGLSLTEYILRLPSTRSLVGQLPTTGSELVTYWQREGVIGTRPDITDSQAHARRIRHKAERRLRE
jgi:hypothetical protein